MMYLITALIAVAAGFCQTVMGFGGGVMMMMVLPGYFPLRIAPTISNAVTAPNSFFIWGRYHKHVALRDIWLPALSYSVFSTLVILLLGDMNMTALRIGFGIFLVILSVYFFFISDRVHIKPTPLAAVLCAALSGTTGGLFGIGGPPMAIYYLAATDTKEEYLGQINGVFSITVVVQLILRFAEGYIPAHFGWILIAGLTGIALGCWTGTKFVDRINHRVLKKIIYAFLALSGVLQILGV